jgi:hypothetical protein
VLSGLAVFVLLSAAMTSLLDWRFPEVIDPTYYAALQYLRQQRPADGGPAPTVVLFGTSRTYDGVDVVRLRESLSGGMGRPVAAVNFGFPSTGFVTDLLTWRRLRRDGVCPDVLLIEVMPSLFVEDAPEQMKEELMPANRLTFFDLGVLEPYRGDTRPRLWGEVALADAAALYTRRYAVVRAVAPSLVPAADDERKPYFWVANRPLAPFAPPAEERSRALAWAHTQYADVLADYRPARCEGLRRLLTACREAGVTAALVVMPEGPVYRSWYGPDTWARIEAWLDEISREQGVEVINTREWMDEADFKDSHHLLPSAAARFTQRLACERILPILRRRGESQ